MILTDIKGADWLGADVFSHYTAIFIAGKTHLNSHFEF